jgi:5'-deoxynucleotidase YfbR-like HD superfamily hydrolase
MATALSDFARAVAEVKALGDRKYGSNTWLGLQPVEFLEAATRHLSEMANGRPIDAESGLPHAAHVCVNMEYLNAVLTDFHDSGPPLVVSLRAREVYRWHTIPVTRPQTLADHSYGVACVVRRLLQVIGRPDLVPVAVEAALDHDIAEVVFGDVPAPAKGATGGFGRYWSESDPLWRRALRVADKLEAYTYVRTFGVGRIAVAAEEQYRSWLAKIPSEPGGPDLNQAARRVQAESLRDPPTSATQAEADAWERK